MSVDWDNKAGLRSYDVQFNNLINTRYTQKQTICIINSSEIFGVFRIHILVYRPGQFQNSTGLFVSAFQLKPIPGIECNSTRYVWSSLIAEYGSTV